MSQLSTKDFLSKAGEGYLEFCRFKDFLQKEEPTKEEESSKEVPLWLQKKLFKNPQLMKKKSDLC